MNEDGQVADAGAPQGAAQPLEGSGVPQQGSAQNAAPAAAAQGGPLEGQEGGAPAADGAGLINGGSPSLLGGASADGEAKPEEGEAKAEGAPEHYEAFKLEGIGDVPAEKMEAFVNTAKEMGLSQESAQKVVDAMLPTAKEYLFKNLSSEVAKWREQSENDPEYGGANLKANLSIASAAYKQFVTPELNTVLESSGLNNHPEVLRLFYRVGKSIQQDPGVAGSASTPAGPRRRYPKSNMVVDQN